jgi:hypothetical protein
VSLTRWSFFRIQTNIDNFPDNPHHWGYQAYCPTVAMPSRMPDFTIANWYDFLSYERRFHSSLLSYSAITITSSRVSGLAMMMARSQVRWSLWSQWRPPSQLWTLLRRSLHILSAFPNLSFKGGPRRRRLCQCKKVWHNLLMLYQSRLVLFLRGLGALPHMQDLKCVVFHQGPNGLCDSDWVAGNSFIQDIHFILTIHI